MLDLEAIKKKCSEFRQKNSQSYIYIEFEGSTFSWGTVSFRKEPSGASTGEVEFTSEEELMEKLDWILGL